MRRKLFFGMVVFMLACLFGVCGSTSCKAAYELVGEETSIGTYQNSEIGCSHVGVSISVDGVNRYFALDSWMKISGEWKYVGSNIGSRKGMYKSSNDMCNDYRIWLWAPQYHSERFMIVGKLAGTLEDCSVVLQRYYLGKLVSTDVEYSFQDETSSPLGDLSLLQSEVELGTFHQEGVSYRYNIYSPCEIGASDKIQVDANGGVLEKSGKGYRAKSGYYIESFPTVSYVKTGYKTTFLGWYSQPEGGKRFSQGDVVPEGTTLYAHWKEEALLYPVTCIDVAGDNTKGEMLGSSSWRQAYGTAVSGAVIGSDSSNDFYYYDYAYTGCSATVVGVSGTTVYRFFKPCDYQIDFDGNGATAGSMASMSGCRYGEMIPLTKSSYSKENKVTLHLNGENALCDTSELYVSQRFIGWSLSQDNNVRYSDGGYFSTTQRHQTAFQLYAVWDEEKKTIPAVPKRMGYEFAGWSEDQEAQTGRTQFLVSSDMDLYAVWKPAVTKYQIEYYKEQLTGNYELVSSYSAEGYTDSMVTLDTETEIYKGFTLDEKASSLSGTVKADGSLVLSAYFRRNSYSLSYDYAGGISINGISVPASVQLKYGEKFVLSKDRLIREGYEFAGWCQEPDGDHTMFQPGDEFTMQNHNVTLYAVWKPIPYHVLFDGNGGIMTEGEMKSQTVSYEEFVLPECSYIKKGYKFSAWNTKPDGSGETYEAGETVKNLSQFGGDDICLYAQWQPIRFWITYDKNVKDTMKSIVGGVVSDTQYCYNGDCYASDILFQAAGYTLKSWNTRPDGTGVSIKPGENIKGKLCSETENRLYAIWEANSNTTFTLHLYQKSQGEEQEQRLDSLTLYGKTDEKISTALERLYQESLFEEEAKYFYEGYVVTNAEMLEQRIKGDCSTELSLLLEQRNCTVTYQTYQNGQPCEAATVGAIAFEKIVLPEKVEGISVSCYGDSFGHTFFPKDCIEVKRDLKLFLQHKVLFAEENGDCLQESYVVHGKGMKLPKIEKKGYRFLGWYTRNGYYIGDSGDYTGSITEDICYIAKWSEPLCYQISYEIDDNRICILENQKTSYCFMEEVILPSASQVWVEEPYQFVGWYYADDPEKKIITKIPMGESGNKVIKALLTKNRTVQEKDETEEKQEEKLSGQIAGAESSSQTASNNNISSETAKQEKSLKGKRFWYHGIRYKILSDTKGKRAVKVISARIKMSRVTIPGKVTYQKRKYCVTEIGKKAFYKMGRIRSIVVPKTVTTIEASAFSKMKDLRQAVLGSSVQKIGEKAFLGAKSLRRLVIKSKKIRKVGKQAFSKTGKGVRVIGKGKMAKKLSDKLAG